MIISFAWTTEALLAGHKTVTRRQWVEKHASKFREGEIVQAYDRNPRNKGSMVADLRVESIIYERTSFMPDSDYRAEGFAYLYGKYGDERASKMAFKAWRSADVPLWVVRFTLLDHIPVEEWLSQQSSRPSRLRLAGSA